MSIKKSEFIKKLGELYRDIYSIKIEKNESFESRMDKFHGVMRKWGICRGTQDENGSVSFNSPEWCFCYNVFLGLLNSRHNMMGLLLDTPKDLYVYSEESETKKQKNEHD